MTKLFVLLMIICSTSLTFANDFLRQEKQLLVCVQKENSTNEPDVYTGIFFRINWKDFEERKTFKVITKDLDVTLDAYTDNKTIEQEYLISFFYLYNKSEESPTEGWGLFEAGQDIQNLRGFKRRMEVFRLSYIDKEIPDSEIPKLCTLNYL